MDGIGMNALAAFGMGRDERTRREVGNALAQGNYQGAQQAAYRGGDASTGMQIGQFRQALQQEASEADERRRAQLGQLYSEIGRTANALRAVPVEQRGSALMASAGRFAPYGATPDMLQQYAEALSDPARSDGVLAALSAAAVDADEVFSAYAPRTLDAGDTVMGYEGGRPTTLAENVDQVGLQNAATARQRAGIEQRRVDLAEREFEAEQSAGPDYGVINEFRQDAEGLLGDFRDIEASYQRIIDSAQSPSAAGDLALIFNYMKMLDPGSAVRETEFANAQNAGGIPARTRALFNQIQRGERLSEEQRADFFSRAQSLYAGQRRLVEQRLSQPREQAEARGLPLDQALPRLAEFETGQDDGGEDEPFTLPSDMQAAIRAYAELPSGALYVTPDGQTHRKP